MADLPSLSVVICAFSSERRDMLRAAIESVQDQTLPVAQTIVVIDHNNPLLTAIAAEYPQLLVVPNDRGAGLAAARNVGVALAVADVVAFLDDDAWADNRWLEQLAQPYADPAVMAVGGRAAAIWSGGRPSWMPAEFEWTVGCTYRGHPQEMSEVRNLFGCNMSFRRQVFSRAGEFSQAFGRNGDDGAGCEETEVCIRARAAFPHSSIIYNPEALVLHRVSSRRATFGYFRARCRGEGRSKAAIVASAGSDAGLATERTYLARVLPAGILRGLLEAVVRLDSSGLKRAAAIVAGLWYVGSSFLLARIGADRTAPLPAAFPPTLVVERDLAQPLSSIDGIDPSSGTEYGSAFCLVRDHGRPVGTVEIPLYGAPVAGQQLHRLLASDIGTPTAAATPARFGEQVPIRVVVATHDRPGPLATCLRSLLGQDYADYEIVVVDNAPSSRETSEMVEGRFGPTGRVSYRREDRPGLGMAHNRGLADTAQPIVAFTDDDVIVDPQWLPAIASAFGISDEVGCVTGLILPAELDTRAQHWTERHGGFGKGFTRRVFDINDGRPKDRLFPFAAGSFGSGANMAFRTSALRQVGGFDAALGAGTIARGGDDLAAFVSVVRAGYQLVYEPEAIVWHHHRRNDEALGVQAYGYGVGLGAYLTKTVLEEPPLLLHFLRSAPWALAHILAPMSAKNRRLPAEYPSSLKWRERLGILVGVPSYLRSRMALRRYLRRQTRAGGRP